MDYNAANNTFQLFFVLSIINRYRYLQLFILISNTITERTIESERDGKIVINCVYFLERNVKKSERREREKKIIKLITFLFLIMCITVVLAAENRLVAVVNRIDSVKFIPFFVFLWFIYTSMCCV